jgi:hypothetical protein
MMNYRSHDVTLAGLEKSVISRGPWLNKNGRHQYLSLITTGMWYQSMKEGNNVYLAL